MISLQVLVLGAVFCLTSSYPQSWQVFYGPGVRQPVLYQQHPFAYTPQVRAPFVYIYDPQTGFRRAQILLADSPEGPTGTVIDTALQWFQQQWQNSVNAGQNFASTIFPAVFRPPETPQSPQKKPESEETPTETVAAPAKPAVSQPAITQPAISQPEPPAAQVKQPVPILLLGGGVAPYQIPESYVAQASQRVVAAAPPHHYFRSQTFQDDDTANQPTPAGRAAISFQKYLALARQKKLKEEEGDTENESSAEADKETETKEAQPTTTTTEAATETSVKDLGQSIAQAKPQATSVAGPGGLAAAAPVATAVVGAGGMALSAPTATAVAGAKGSGAKQGPSSKLRPQLRNLPSYYLDY